MNRLAKNPILPGFHPDPSICAFDGRYLLVTSSFEYFPAIPIFESDDLVSWRQIGHCLDAPDLVDLAGAGSSQGFFAPTIRSHAGVLYMTVTNVNRPGHQLFSAPRPEGPWTGPVIIEQNGIDPSLFFDDDGTVYFQSNIEPNPSTEHVLLPDFERGIQQSVIDVTTGEILSGPKLIWTGSGGRFPEAPHLYKRGDWYYLLAAEGGTERGHIATMARARSPWGPFESHPRNPVLSHRSLPLEVQSVGHADMIKLDDGQWWAVCLGTRPVGDWHHLGRETFLVPVEWADDGWPDFGHAGTVPDEFVPPREARPQNTAHVAVDEFDSAGLDPVWNTLRGPLGDRLEVGRGLRLTGGPATLSELDVTFIGRRLQFFDAEAVAELRSSGPGDAGIVVRLDERHFVALAIRPAPDGNRLVLRRKIGPVASDEVVGRIGGSATLHARFSPEWVEFSVRDADGERPAGRHELRYVSTEVAGGFTGAYIGLFAEGESTQLRCDSFSYRQIAKVEGVAGGA